MRINFKAPRRLIAAFKALLYNRISPEDKHLLKRITQSSTKVTEHGLSGYKVDSPIDDPENLAKELDRSRFIVENESKLRDKDEVYRQALLVLLKSVEIKTVKIDKLIEELEDMK